MPRRLLDRQASLLAYLTSGAAIFGDRGDTSVPDVHELDLRGLDRGLLRLEARFSHEKRMEKIIAALPRTYRLLGADRAAVVREFVDRYPPADIDRLANAGQFYAHLIDRWRREPPQPPYLPDLAACELACARARARVDAGAAALPEVGPIRPSPAIRRHPAIILLRCAFDVRPLFEAAETAPTRRDTRLGVAPPDDSHSARIFELPPVAFDLLAALDDWVDLEAIAGPGDRDGPIDEFTRHGLIQVRG